MISKWKKEFIERSCEIFETRPPEENFEAEKQLLFAKIGQFEMERDWLKKKFKKGRTMNELKGYISYNEYISILMQCDLIDINRSTVYYNAVPESDENIQIMRLLDEEFLDYPTHGVFQMQDFLFSL